MKKVLLAVLLLGSLPCLAQNSSTPVNQVKPKYPNPTTEEEYNYATKGLGIQRASGLDMKAGYQLTNKTVFVEPSAGVMVQIEDLVRSADNSLACIVIRIEYLATKNVSYLAIPNEADLGQVRSGLVEEQYKKSFSQINSLNLNRAILIAMTQRAKWLETSLYMKK
jgi:CCR4-NOT transcriptional regulation complex NOT5 subunit